MKPTLLKIILFFAVLAGVHLSSFSQLQVTNVTSGDALVQQLLGQGITVSNVVLTGHPAMAGTFRNFGSTNIGLDSGIVLTNGVAETNKPAGKIGMNGNGSTPASNVNAFNRWNFPGDADLSAIVGDVTKDACVLEFDFVPLGDTVKFRYVFSSEEYTDYSCSQFNDAFAFFISGPGITGQQNIALIPGTVQPVTINNINPDWCAAYPQFYVDNLTNKYFTYDGHTTIFTALSRVQPCQTYHLKLVVADVSDDDLDSGVFLEAKSLSSNAIQLNNLTQTDQTGNSYLVEGCATGSFKIKRPQADPSPLVVQLSYGGTATNGVDYTLLPTSVTIPGGQQEVTLNVVPVIDNTPEGIETIKVYALAGCTSGLPTDSTQIQIRDYDTLGITPDTSRLCAHGSVQLVATTGYTTYQWDPDPTLSNTNIRTPIASPLNPTMYYCTATEGTCHGRDSAFAMIKTLDFVSKQDVNCAGASTGEIRVSGGWEWDQPVEYNLNSGAWQADSTFTNLPVGTYTARIKDPAGCIDSMIINITQLYPDLIVLGTPVTAATCSGLPDGSITVVMTGGKAPYQYSLDGFTFQTTNVFNVIPGTYTITTLDANNCVATKTVVVPLFNPLTVDAGPDLIMCEGKQVQINAVSTGTSFAWTPAATLNDPTILNPIATPAATTKYYLTATFGICTTNDSVTVFVNPAPIPNAGPDQSICFGRATTLSGSGGVQYFWQPSSYLDNSHNQNPAVRPLTGTITYSLNVIDANNCPSLQPDFVKITVTKEAKVFAGFDTTVATNQPVPLHALDMNGSGFTSYEWIPAINLNNSQIADPVSTPDRNMWYTVIAKTALGCEARDDIKITVYNGPEIYVPQGFTPDGNGINDVLKAVPAGIREFHYFRVYDRWGRLVFATTDPGIGWDGKINGSVQSTGTYVWMAEGVDYRGNILFRKGTTIIIH